MSTATIQPTAKAQYNAPHLSIDTTQAQSFIRALQGDRDTVLFQMFSDREKCGHSRKEDGCAVCDLKKTRKGTLDQLRDILKRGQNSGAGVFVTVNETDGSGKRQNKNIVGINALFADFDEPSLTQEALRERLSATELPHPNIVVKTKNGFHTYWLITEGLEKLFFGSYQKRLAQLLGSDPAVCDQARVMRLPGSWHQKEEEAFLCTLIETTEGRHDWEIFDAILPKLETKQSGNKKVHIPGSGSGKIAALLDDIRTAAKGTGNDTVSRVAFGLGQYIGKGRCDRHWAEDEYRKALVEGGRSPDAHAATFQSQLERGIDQGIFEIESEKEKVKLPVFAEEIAEDLQSTLAYNTSSGVWYLYESELAGQWSSGAIEAVQAIIVAKIKTQLRFVPSPSQIDTVYRLFKVFLQVHKWEEKKGLIPFQNGVLNVATGEFLDHDPGFRFTWQVPRSHDPLATDWQVIEHWMDQASQGSEPIKKILLCWMNAVLKGRSDLQKFLLLTGNGGSGKGTYFRLVSDLIGHQNIHTTSLKDWCTEKFDTVNAFGKRLISFPEQSRYHGDLDRFKSATGQDLIRAEIKQGKAFSYVFDGMVMMCSNQAVFGADDNNYSIYRRGITVPFNLKVSSKERRNLNEEFKPFLSALTNYVLAIPDEEVTATLLQINESEEVLSQKIEHLIRTDPVAEWLNEYLIFDENAQTRVGNEKENFSTLYGHFCNFANNANRKVRCSAEFSSSLCGILTNYLNFELESKKSASWKRGIKGLRLRTPADDLKPFLLDNLSNTHAEESEESEIVPTAIDTTDEASKKIVETKTAECKEVLENIAERCPKEGTKGDDEHAIELKEVRFSFEAGIFESAIDSLPSVKKKKLDRLFLVINTADRSSSVPPVDDVVEAPPFS